MWNESRIGAPQPAQRPPPPSVPAGTRCNQAAATDIPKGNRSDWFNGALKPKLDHRHSKVQHKTTKESLKIKEGCAAGVVDRLRKTHINLLSEPSGLRMDMMVLTSRLHLLCVKRRRYSVPGSFTALRSCSLPGEGSDDADAQLPEPSSLPVVNTPELAELTVKVRRERVQVWFAAKNTVSRPPGRVALPSLTS